MRNCEDHVSQNNVSTLVYKHAQFFLCRCPSILPECFLKFTATAWWSWPCCVANSPSASRTCPKTPFHTWPCIQESWHNSIAFSSALAFNVAKSNYCARCFHTGVLAFSQSELHNINFTMWREDLWDLRDHVHSISCWNQSATRL